MASFGEAPAGNKDVGAKIFKTKCAQCHTVEQGQGHKQGYKKPGARKMGRQGHSQQSKNS
uniref:Cytochrome c domain-containing protein n=1 Tax=Daucus carota subsp. sativus TaxID=79200 RepID=A0A162AGC1_DAUCS